MNGHIFHPRGMSHFGDDILPSVIFENPLMYCYMFCFIGSLQKSKQMKIPTYVMNS